MAEVVGVCLKGHAYSRRSSAGFCASTCPAATSPSGCTATASRVAGADCSPSPCQQTNPMHRGLSAIKIPILHIEISL